MHENCLVLRPTKNNAWQSRNDSNSSDLACGTLGCNIEVRWLRGEGLGIWLLRLHLSWSSYPEFGCVCLLLGLLLIQCWQLGERSLFSHFRCISCHSCLARTLVRKADLVLVKLVLQSRGMVASEEDLGPGCCWTSTFSCLGRRSWDVIFWLGLDSSGNLVDLVF